MNLIKFIILFNVKDDLSFITDKKYYLIVK